MPDISGAFAAVVAARVGLLSGKCSFFDLLCFAMDTIRSKIYLLHHELTEALFHQSSAENKFEEQTTGRAPLGRGIWGMSRTDMCKIAKKLI